MENLILRSSIGVVYKVDGSSPIMGRLVFTTTSSKVGLNIPNGKTNPFKGVDQKLAKENTKSS